MTFSQSFDAWSFPSGHAFLAVTLFGAIALTARRVLVRRRALALTCALLATSVGLSRVILGVHWLSDVIAGAVLGLCWVSFVYLVDEAVRARETAVRAGIRARAQQPEKQSQRKLRKKRISAA